MSWVSVSQTCSSEHRPRQEGRLVQISVCTLLTSFHWCQHADAVFEVRNAAQVLFQFSVLQLKRCGVRRQMDPSLIGSVADFVLFI